MLLDLPESPHPFFFFFPRRPTPISRVSRAKAVRRSPPALPRANQTDGAPLNAANSAANSRLSIPLVAEAATN